MLVREVGSVRLLKLVQFANASKPMEVTPLGRVRLVRPEQL
jgi:hypothetical protein